MGIVEPLRRYFSDLVPVDDQSWQALLAVSARQTFCSGEHIFLTGDITPQVRFLISGVACHYYIKPDGNRLNKAFLQCGDVASSLSSLHSGIPARFGCDVLIDAECLAVNYDDLSQLALKWPVWRQLRELLIMRLALRKEAREADLLLLSPTERYLNFLEDFPELNQKLPNYHIAAYLGIAEVSLSRIRARLGVQNEYKKS